MGCPRETTVTNTLKCTGRYAPQGDVNQIIIEQSALSHDVPFGQNFLTQSRILLQVQEDKSVSFTQHGRVMFLKSCGFLKSTIQKGAIKGVADAAQLLASILADYEPASPAGDVASRPGSSTSPINEQPRDIPRRKTATTVCDSDEISVGSPSPASSSHLRRSPTGSNAATIQRRSSKGKSCFTLKLYELQ